MARYRYTFRQDWDENGPQFFEAVIEAEEPKSREERQVLEGQAHSMMMLNSPRCQHPLRLTRVEGPLPELQESIHPLLAQYNSLKLAYDLAKARVRPWAGHMTATEVAMNEQAAAYAQQLWEQCHILFAQLIEKGIICEDKQEAAA